MLNVLECNFGPASSPDGEVVGACWYSKLVLRPQVV